MNFNRSTPSLADGLPGYQASEITVAPLVGEVYAEASAPERSRMQAFLLKPLGVFALVAVADGIVATIRFRGRWGDQHLQLDDISRVQPGDFTALVDRLQQVSGDAVDGLASILSASPVVIASSAAAALLVALLMQRARIRREATEASDGDTNFEPQREPVLHLQTPQPCTGQQARRGPAIPFSPKDPICRS